MPTCARCSNEFELTRQQRLRPGVRSNYCCHNCYRAYMDSRVVTFTCTHCGNEHSMPVGSKRCRRRKGIPEDLCSPCAMGLANNTSGAKNGNWKGGHRHWSPGRFGRDKDGLSWKVQRRLAWERDHYTCQECGTKPKRNPDVHHIIPFRISQSHALDNLKCLCQRCHLQEEARVQEPWGGQLRMNPKCPSPPPLPKAPRPKKDKQPRPPKPRAVKPVKERPKKEPRIPWLRGHRTPRNTARWSDADLIRLAPQSVSLADLMRKLGFKTPKGNSRTLLKAALVRLGLDYPTINAPVA